jgi:cycloeucalenol cycloisomerase
LSLLSPDPAARDTERFALLYSPVWIAVIGALQFGGWFARWGDLEHLALGVGLALPLWLSPLVQRERGFAIRWQLLIALFSFLQCYFGSALFFDAFGMQYHFHTRWILNGTPLFLYFVTVAYFSTYYVFLVIAWRAIRTRFPDSRAVRIGSQALLSYSVAFAETAAMATPRMHDFFSYRDPHWVMWYGSICYGAVFFVSLPLFYDLDKKRPLRAVAWDALAANMLILVLYEVFLAVIKRM